MTEDQLIEGILRREGGFVDSTFDRGGPTKYGISTITLSWWRKTPVTREDVLNLTVEEAKEIYREEYIRAPGFDKVKDDRLRALLVDCGVNHGVRSAVRMLQRALGVTDDGVMGPVTRAEIDKIHGPDSFCSECECTDAANAYDRLLAQRIRLYGRIISNDPTQAKFAKGWLARAAEFLEG